MLYELIAILVCIWLLETIRPLDFVADGAYDLELIIERFSTTALLGGVLMVIPALLQYISLRTNVKGDSNLKPSLILNSMLFSTLRGWAYYIAISQWNTFALNKYIGHCSQ